MPEDLRRPEAVDSPAPRRRYLDWMRGVAVLIMIEAHLVDSWTAPPDRLGKVFEWAMVLGGFGAPLFLLLAGVSVALSAAARARRTGDVRAAALAVMRRGGEIFLLAFVFRVQAWILGWSSVRTLLRVDILNIMGPAIVAAAALWGAWSRPRGRAIALLAATLATAFLTPVFRVAPWLSPLPDPIEAYLRPAGGYTSFMFMPWAGFVFAGALLGLCVDAVRSSPPSSSAASSQESRLHWSFGIGGALLALAAYAASFLPPLSAGSEFWTTSPAFFLLRLGVLITAVALSYAWTTRFRPKGGWSAVEQLGRTSLFIYWIHVEMVYGLVSLPLHHALTLPQAWVALTLFCGFMLACSLAKDRVVAWRQARRQRLGVTETMPAR